MIVEIFGPPDRRRDELERSVRRALDELGLSRGATIYRIEDPASMVGRGVWRAPGLAVGGKVVARGRELTAAEVEDLLRAAAG